MRTCRCEAIVLATMDYRETDRLATMLTMEHGKLRVIARGAKRSQRRFGAALESFARLQAELLLRDGLIPLLHTDILTLHHGIRGDLGRLGHAAYAVELVDRFLPEGLPNARLFRLLDSYLKHLDSQPAAPSDRRFYEANLLNILGYRLALHGCSGCGHRPAADESCRYNVASGELHCCRCPGAGLPLAASTMALLERTLAIGRFNNLTFPPAELAEAGTLLDAAIAVHLERPLAALAFLRDMGE